MSNIVHSIAYVLTRYQYNILLAALDKLQINKLTVVLIIAKKAQQQGVDGEGFMHVLFYDDKNESIKYWKNLKNEIDTLLEVVDFYPQNIFLRNFNATISRVLMSRYPDATLYLIEEGMPSYMKGNYMGCSSSIREKLKTMVTRMLFSKGALRVLPVNRQKTVKVGLLETMKPWLDVPYLPVKLSQGDFTLSKELVGEERYDVEVLIIDQPLWQIGMSIEETREIYADIFRYLEQRGIAKGKIGIKLHPSSNKKELESLFFDADNGESVRIFEGKENLEELLFTGRLKSVKTFVGFFSWALCLIQAHKPSDNVNVIAFSNKILDIKVSEAYHIMESMKIEIRRDENGR